MLVLSRKPGQSIAVGTPLGDVTIRVLSVTGRAVKLGIDANREISIVRDDANMRTPGTPDWLDRIGDSVEAVRKR